MKKLALILSIGIFFVSVQNISAQTKKLLVFKKGIAVATGTIKGSETKVYYFKIKKDTDMEITLDDINSKPKFILYKPNGKPFYADGEVNSGDATDMMDVLPEAGTYKIVVKLPDNLQSEPQPIKFTLRLILK
jgi:hypothetical protein